MHINIAFFCVYFLGVLGSQGPQRYKENGQTYRTGSYSSPMIQVCNASQLSQQWIYTQSSGYLRSGTSGLCLTASGDPTADGTSLTMATCGSTQASYQAFDFVTEGNFIVVRAAPSKCVNIEAYGTTPGAQVWLYGCMGAGYTCEGNCDWESYPSNAPGSNLFRNNESKLCLDDGALPVIPRTCSPGSVSSGLPFCNYSLSFEARAEDLVARLPLDYKLALIMLPFPVAPAQLAYPPLDIAAFFWDM